MDNIGMVNMKGRSARLLERLGRATSERVRKPKRGPMPKPDTLADLVEARLGVAAVEREAA